MTLPIRSSAPRAGRIRTLLQAHGLRPRKRRGQHFLADPEIRDRIVKAAGVIPGTAVIEIGPGTGELTEALLAAGASVLALELDPDLAAILSERLGGFPELTVRIADVLTFDFNAELGDHPARGALRVVANIPYYITTPLVLRLLEFPALFRQLFLTVQKEVADRLEAVPGSKAYGALTLACQYRAATHRIFLIPRSAFYPAPEVDSALVRFDLLESPPVHAANPSNLFAVIRAAFGQRRKTLRNALRHGGWEPAVVEAALERVGIAATRRGETLRLEEFARLSDALPSGGGSRG